MEFKPLRTVIFFGSVRSPFRLGLRVLKYFEKVLIERKHEVQVIDPLVHKLPILEQAYHHYKPGEKIPEELEALAKKLSWADCFLIVSPEYNHSIPPALSNMLDHFGPKQYNFKPSGIVTYSSGPYGGSRAAIQLRSITGALGCVSVSNLVCIGNAQNEFDEEGKPINPEMWPKRAENLLKELEWTANAFRNHRSLVGVPY